MKTLYGIYLKTISVIFALFCFYSAAGQVPSHKKPKAYKIWVKLSDIKVVPQGILYETGDSSITVSGSLNDNYPRIYNYKNIEVLKIRRLNSILKGGLIGSSAGFVGGIVAVNSVEGGLDFMTVPVSVVAGLTFGALGAGCGIIAGSVRDRIEVKHDYGKFEKYRGNLQNYSFVTEKTPAKKIFAHRSFIEANIGFSFAREEFVNSLPFSEYLGMGMTGTSFSLSGGYHINTTIGIKASFISNMYSVSFTKDYSSVASANRQVSWELDAIMISPVVSLPVYRQLSVDVCPGIGYASACLADDDKFILNGEGLTLNINCALVYNYSKRWFASAGIGYLSSGQKYQEGGSGQARSMDVRLGIAYKFGRRSL